MSTPRDRAEQWCRKRMDASPLRRRHEDSLTEEFAAARDEALDEAAEFAWQFALDLERNGEHHSKIVAVQISTRIRALKSRAPAKESDEQGS